MNKNFLAKKSWHTGNIKHQEKVWLAEQREEAERKKIEELKRELQREQNRHDLVQARIGYEGASKYREKLDWMYKGNHTPQVSSEELLTGQKEAVIENDKEDLKTPSLLQATKDPPAPSRRDAETKLLEDPLLLIKRQEKESIEYITKNPVKMKQIKKELKKLDKKDRKEKKSKKEKKEDRKERKERKEKERDHHHHHSHSHSSSSSSSKKRKHSSDEGDDDRVYKRQKSDSSLSSSSNRHSSSSHHNHSHHHHHDHNSNSNNNNNNYRRRHRSSNLTDEERERRLREMQEDAENSYLVKLNRIRKDDEEAKHDAKQLNERDETKRNFLQFVFLFLFLYYSFFHYL